MRIVKTKEFAKFSKRERISNSALCEGTGMQFRKKSIDDDELDVMKEFASIWFNADERKIKLSLKEGVLEEIEYEKKT